MTCPHCGAQTQGNFCAYCGSELPKEAATVNITNHYYGTAQPGSSAARCPRCGSAGVTFSREQVSRSVYQTVGLCPNCGHTYVRDTGKSKSGRKTWLWVLGWLFLFPLPLTILLLRKKDMKPWLKYGIIILAWALFLIIGTSQDPAAEAPQSAAPYAIVAQAQPSASRTY